MMSIFDRTCSRIYLARLERVRLFTKADPRKRPVQALRHTDA